MLSTATSSPIPGLAPKAWALVNGLTGAIIKSSGITSVTRSSAGTYNVVFSTAMSSVFYLCVVLKDPLDSATRNVNSTGRGTGIVTINSQLEAGTFLDLQIFHFAIYE